MLSAIRALGPDAKATAYHDYFEHLHDFAGTSGVYDFRTGDQRGLGADNIIMSQWVPAQQTWVGLK